MIGADTHGLRGSWRSGYPSKLEKPQQITLHDHTRIGGCHLMQAAEELNWRLCHCGIVSSMAEQRYFKSGGSLRIAIREAA